MSPPYFAAPEQLRLRMYYIGEISTSRQFPLPTFPSLMIFLLTLFISKYSMSCSLLASATLHDFFWLGSSISLCASKAASSYLSLFYSFAPNDGYIYESN